MPQLGLHKAYSTVRCPRWMPSPARCPGQGHGAAAIAKCVCGGWGPVLCWAMLPTHLAPRVRLAAAWLKAHPDSSFEPAAEGVRVRLAKEAIGGSVALRRLRSVSQGAAAVLPPPELGIGRGLAKLSSACNSCDPCSSAAEQPGRLAVQAQHSQAFGRPPPSAAVRCWRLQSGVSRRSSGSPNGCQGARRARSQRAQHAEPHFPGGEQGK